MAGCIMRNLSRKNRTLLEGCGDFDLYRYVAFTHGWLHRLTRSQTSLLYTAKLMDPGGSGKTPRRAVMGSNSKMELWTLTGPVLVSSSLNISI